MEALLRCDCGALVPVTHEGEYLQAQGDAAQKGCVGMVRVRPSDAPPEASAPPAGCCCECGTGVRPEQVRCAACARAHRRAHVHTGRGRRVACEAQRRYRARWRGSFADQSGLVRLLGNELRLRAGALALPRRLSAACSEPMAAG